MCAVVMTCAELTCTKGIQRVLLKDWKGSRTSLAAGGVVPSAFLLVLLFCEQSLCALLLFLHVRQRNCDAIHYLIAVYGEFPFLLFQHPLNDGVAFPCPPPEFEVGHAQVLAPGFQSFSS